MIRLYKEHDFEHLGYSKGKKTIRFSPSLSERPEEFTEKSFVELLTENKSTPYSLYSIKRIMQDEETGLFFPESFAVNYGDHLVDSRPLVRGFIPEGPWSRKQTLYEIMPRKKQIHIIPDPQRRLFYEEDKVGHTFYFEWNGLKEVLDEFASSRFLFLEFPARFDSLINSENSKRYIGEP